MTQEQKAKAYDEAIERARKWYDANTNEGYRGIFEEIFPELAESEDEKIKKEITELVMEPSWKTEKEFHRRLELCVWLKKQGSLKDIVDRHKDSWYNEGKIAGMAEGLTDDEKYQQGWHDALEKQDEKSVIIDIDKMVSKYANTKEDCTNGLPVNCQIRAYRQGINDALRLSLNLEKQGEQKPTWSEEDTSLCIRIQGILSVCKSNSLLSPDLCKEMCDWLKSLKERVQPNQWKPSKEQIETLEYYILYLTDCKQKEVLFGLYDQLKKLNNN